MALSALKPEDILIVMALEKEGGERLEPLGFPVLYCGLGKVNATYALTKALAGERLESNPRLILNLGTAGSSVFAKGQLVACHQFIERDMDVRPLGYELFETPFDSLPIQLDTKPFFEELESGICGTGDHFDVKHDPNNGQLVDMEAYALAKVALQEGIDFACAKYISDGADDSAESDWYDSLHTAPEKFETLVKEHFDV